MDSYESFSQLRIILRGNKNLLKFRFNRGICKCNKLVLRDNGLESFCLSIYNEINSIDYVRTYVHKYLYYLCAKLKTKKTLIIYLLLQ